MWEQGGPEPSFLCSQKKIKNKKIPPIITTYNCKKYINVHWKHVLKGALCSFGGKIFTETVFCYGKNKYFWVCVITSLILSFFSKKTQRPFDCRRKAMWAKLKYNEWLLLNCGWRWKISKMGLNYVKRLKYHGCKCDNYWVFLLIKIQRVSFK